MYQHLVVSMKQVCYDKPQHFFQKTPRGFIIDIVSSQNMTETTCPQQEIATQQVSQDPGRENPLEGFRPITYRYTVSWFTIVI